MFRRFSVNFALFSIGLDALLLTLALTLAVRLRPQLNILPFAQFIPAPIPVPWFFFLIFPLVWIGICLLFSVYDGRRNLRFVNEISSLTIASLLASFFLAGLLYLTYRDVSRLLFLSFTLSGYIFLLTWRLIARIALKNRRIRIPGNRRVLIIGTGETGKQLEQIILSNPVFGLTVVGFVSEQEQGPLGETVLGTLGQTQTIIDSARIDDVVIALPRSAHETINQLVADLHRMPVKVWIIPDYFQLALHKAVAEEFAGLLMLDLRAPAINEYQRLMKRAFDIAITILILPFCLVIMGIIYLAIYLENGRPVLLRQRRVGENGVFFEMFKFRSMVKDAENLQPIFKRLDEHGQLIHKIPDDPRVTHIGRFLRRRSLDEMPQLFNVLRGEMSLVGPRPELPELVTAYEPWQWKRFTVPQGMTGWWQINGRSDKPMHLHTEDDLFYVQNYSMLLDIRILMKTLGVVLMGKGAY